MSKVMAVNAGSSSIKYKLFEMPSEKVICSGIVDKIGHDDAIFKISFLGQDKKTILPIMDHGKGVELILNAIIENEIVADLNEIEAVGHRIVQGGKYFAHSVMLNDEVAKKIEELIPLDPLHAPAHLLGYRAFLKALPNALPVAIFDTAFHQTMEEEDYLYPIPHEWTEKYDCRRYGAHGTSHQYLMETAIDTWFNGKKEGTRIITCHIGSGASLAAIKDGKCVATSMGLTPLGGIMMGTRSGDIDPSILDYIATCTGKDVHELYEDLNRKSGLLGVSGFSNDSRDVEEKSLAGDERSLRASNLFARRIADFIGQYFVRLGGADLIIFSAGIGENSPYYRELVLRRVEDALNLKIDYEQNVKGNRKLGLISKTDSPIKVAIIPTDEEVMIARDSIKALKGELE